MKRRRKRGGGIDFGTRRAPASGILSSCLFGAESLLFLGTVYFSYLKQGAAGAAVGAAGSLIFILAAAGTIAGIRGVRKKGYHHGSAWFGFLANAAVLAAMGTLFAVGLRS